MPEDIFPILNNFFTKEQSARNMPLRNNGYMIIKFLSLYPVTFNVADKANKLSTKIPEWAVNYFLFYSIPRQRVPRATYPKSTAKEKQWDKILMAKVMQVFNCGMDHAGQILNILSGIDKNIIETFGVETKK